MKTTVSELAAGVLAGNRRALARSITLVESGLPYDRRAAEELIQAIDARRGRTFRLGLSGVPGAGKSTFIERFGLEWIRRGSRLAVLAVDPSSTISGGSVLGDKTRMPELSVHPNAFIRPSPTGGHLGGVARRTREAMLLCEAAGYDAIIVETVGVGQSEVVVSEMTDFYLLLMLPNAGDELQGIKKGVLELADCLAVNKIDRDRPAAQRARADLQSAVRLLRRRIPDWVPPVLMVSALTGEGLDRLFRTMDRFRDVTASANPGGLFQLRRRNQRRDWLHATLREDVLEAFENHPLVRSRMPEIERQVLAGEMAPPLAARALLESFLAR